MTTTFAGSGAGSGGGGVAGAEPIQHFGLGGALVMYLSPRNSRNRYLLTPADTMPQLTSRNVSQKEPHICGYIVMSVPIIPSSLTRPGTFLNSTCDICIDQLLLKRSFFFSETKGIRVIHTQLD